MAATLTPPKSPKDRRSYSAISENQRLLNWELDLVQGAEVETVGKTIVGYQSLCEQIEKYADDLHKKRQCVSFEIQEPVWMVGSWHALEAVEQKTEEAKEYAKMKLQLDARILEMKLIIERKKITHITEVTRSLKVRISTQNTHVHVSDLK